jgi:hypothetical protein
MGKVGRSLRARRQVFAAPYRLGGTARPKLVFDIFMGIWEYGPMKTTLEIPDELFREAKAKAALEGRRLKDLVADGLRAVLAAGLAQRGPRRARFPIIKATPGAPVITKKMVDEAEEQMLREEAKHYAKLMRR